MGFFYAQSFVVWFFILILCLLLLPILSLAAWGWLFVFVKTRYMVILQMENTDSSIDVKSFEASEVSVAFRGFSHDWNGHEFAAKLTLAMIALNGGEAATDKQIDESRKFIAVVTMKVGDGVLRAAILDDTKSMRIYLNGVLVAKASSPTPTSHGKAFSRVGLDS